jgi:hypothetical protein
MLGFYPIISTQLAYAQNEQIEADAKEAAGYMSYLNRSVLMEPAGSIGSMGMPIGVALTQQSTLPEENLMARQLIGYDKEDSYLRNTSLHLHKGTDWPVDLGLAVGNMQGTSIHTLGAYIQATVLEDLGVPSISIRALWSSMYGLKDANVSSAGAEVIISQGMLRYFNFFASARVEQSRVSMSLDDSEYYGLYHEDGTWSHNENLNTQSLSGGLRINLLPDLNTTVEANRDQRAYTSYGLKIGLLL